VKLTPQLSEFILYQVNALHRIESCIDKVITAIAIHIEKRFVQIWEFEINWCVGDKVIGIVNEPDWVWVMVIQIAGKRYSYPSWLNFHCVK